jgi:2-oxoglutarate decarboxylase
MTLTSTYDHRVIQGAQSGEFLRKVHQLLLGEDGFYDEIFRRCGSPTSRSAGRDIPRPRRRDQQAGPVLELIHAYRVRGHLMADTDPLEYKAAQPPRPRGRVTTA